MQQIKEFKTILFDMDGTLNESGAGIMNSAAYAFEQKGLPVPSEEILRAFVGPPLRDSFMQHANMTEEQALEAVFIYRERFSRIGWMENSLYPGITPLLRALKRRGAYLAIASGKPLIFVERILKHFGIDDCFDCVKGISGEAKAETKSELIRSALPENCDLSTACMIGDRRFDMEAARAEGLTAVGVTYGYGTREELTCAGADLIADSVRELYDILLPGVPFPRGKMITFEGADGCGKSTQLRKLNEWLLSRGYETVVSREPGGCPISERIREVVLEVAGTGMTAECEALLFAAARAEHVKSVILPALEQGKILLCDRYLDSSIAYQAYGRELGEEFIRQINKTACAAVPDRTLLFRGDRQVVSARLRSQGELDRIEREQDSFVVRIYDAFDRIAENEPERVHVIESNRTVEEIFEDVLKDISELLKG